MIRRCTLVFVLLWSASVFGFKRPDEPCKLQDIKCLTTFGQEAFKVIMAGDKELGIKSLDPLVEKSIVITLPTVKYTLTDSTVTGLSQCEVKEVSIPRPNTIHVSLVYPQYQLCGNCKIDGEFLEMPVVGDGECFFDATNIGLELEINKEYFEKNGKRHFKISSYTVKSRLLGTMQMDISNIFGGKAEKAKKFNKLARQHQEDVFEIWGTPLQNVHLKTVVENLNKLFENIPLDDMVEVH